MRMLDKAVNPIDKVGVDSVGKALDSSTGRMSKQADRSKVSY